MKNDLVFMLMGGFIFLPMIGIIVTIFGGFLYFVQPFIKRKLYSKSVMITGLCILGLAIVCAVFAWVLGGPGVFNA